MKRIKILGLIAIGAVVSTQTSCLNLDLKPETGVSPEVYFNTSDQLEAYVNNAIQPGGVGTSPFRDWLHGGWSYGAYGNDSDSDSQMNKGAGGHWLKEGWRTPTDDNTNPYDQDDGLGEWNFTHIYKANYFFNFVLPKFEAGQISGDQVSIRHSIGEMYFLRAWTYFRKLHAFGDFPIITEIVPNNFEALVEASKRAPRTDVAHFILEDLDRALELLSPTKPTTHITPRAVHLLKSRVALHEGTWLKYFKGTPFVPNGPGWPGAEKEYNAGYQFPLGGIDAEIEFFLTTAMTSAKIVADATTLTTNNGLLQQSTTDTPNPYLNMFGQIDLSAVNEVIFWKPYQMASGGQTHSVTWALQNGAYTNGFTKFYVDNFLMASGKPIYADGSGYHGDDELVDVVKDRDNRLFLFMKVPGQLNYFLPTQADRTKVGPEGYPDILDTAQETQYSTGYTPRKGINFDSSTHFETQASATTGAIVLRGVEAYLNYMEACVEKNGVLDATGQAYWSAVRSRGNATPVTWADIQANTIAFTDMNKEADTDFAAMSAGQLIDPLLYNIRRERRMEFSSEGHRLRDLRRWRALDQLIDTPRHFEGFKLWGPMQHNWPYENEDDGTTRLIYGMTNANVSAPLSAGGSDYLRPAERDMAGKVYLQGGHTWMMAHYFHPIAYAHFTVSSPDGVTVSESPIYQNPYWPLQPEVYAEQ
ncbi:MAG: RagB/SusD family nutrient uptake outer membrane protein [Alistipes sp.]|jgi:hypothetical protein|nr:RagB/SusD family nutrient uptake outer membrane protein [Alistipes sp.]